MSVNTTDDARRIEGILQEFKLEFEQMMSELKQLRNIKEMKVMLREIELEIKQAKFQIGPHVRHTFELNLYTKIQQYTERATYQIEHELENHDLNNSEDVVTILDAAIKLVYLPYFLFSEPIAFFPEHVMNSFVGVFQRYEGQDMARIVHEAHACYGKLRGSRVENNDTPEARPEAKNSQSSGIKNDAKPNNADHEAKGVKLKDSGYKREGGEQENTESNIESSQDDIAGKTYDSRKNTLKDFEISFKDESKDEDADSSISSLSTGYKPPNSTAFTSAVQTTAVQAALNSIDWGQLIVDALKELDWEKMFQDAFQAAEWQKVIQPSEQVATMISVVNESLKMYEKISILSSWTLPFFDPIFREAATKIDETNRDVEKLNKKMIQLLHKVREKTGQLHKKSDEEVVNLFSKLMSSDSSFHSQQSKEIRA